MDQLEIELEKMEFITHSVSFICSDLRCPCCDEQTKFILRSFELSVN